MFFGDHHSHSSCSPDGNVSMLEMGKGALVAGLNSLCVTDHCDFLSLDGKERTLEYDWKPVLEQFHEAKLSLGDKLDLRLGLEFGMGFLDYEAAERVISLPELDFIIGSVHNLREDMGGGDFYFGKYDTEKYCYDALENYFTSMNFLAESPFYDVLGHIPYPVRYMKGDYAPIDMWRFTDHIRSAMTKAIDTGRGIEFNTWKGNSMAEWLPILKEYKALHGEIITVGSDAHDPAPIGKGIKDAYTMMADVGFRYVATFRGRKVSFEKI